MALCRGPQKSSSRSPPCRVSKKYEAVLAKKRGYKTSINYSSNHSFSGLSHTTRAGNTDVGKGFVGKISAPELLPSQIMSFSLQLWRRNPSRITPYDQTMPRPAGILQQTGLFPSFLPFFVRIAV